VSLSGLTREQHRLARSLADRQRAKKKKSCLVARTLNKSVKRPAYAFPTGGKVAETHVRVPASKHGAAPKGPATNETPPRREPTTRGAQTKAPHRTREGESGRADPDPGPPARGPQTRHAPPPEIQAQPPLPPAPRTTLWLRRIPQYRRVLGSESSRGPRCRSLTTAVPSPTRNCVGPHEQLPGAGTRCDAIGEHLDRRLSAAIFSSAARVTAY